MHKFAAAFITTFIFMILAGCSSIQMDYTLNLAKVTAFVTDLRYQYEQVEKVIIAVQPKMTEDERMTVDVAKIKFRDLINKLDSMAKLESYRISTFEMSYMWNTVITERDRIRENVVRPHWMDFGIAEQYLLKMFDESIDRTDVEIKQLIANPTHDNLSRALDLMSTGLLFGVRVLGLGATVL